MGRAGTSYRYDWVLTWTTLAGVLWSEITLHQLCRRAAERRAGSLTRVAVTHAGEPLRASLRRSSPIVD